MTRVSGPPMSALGAVLARVVADAEFRSLLAKDPDTALIGYPVDDLDRELLAEHLAADVASPGDQGAPARPLSRHAIFGFLDDLVAVRRRIAGHGQTVQQFDVESP